MRPQNAFSRFACLLGILLMMLLETFAYDLTIIPTYVTFTHSWGEGYVWGKSEIQPVSVAVGDDFLAYIWGGVQLGLGPDAEYVFGNCGYGYLWDYCLDGSCYHGVEYGLDVDQCNINNSAYLRYKVDGVQTDYAYNIMGASTLTTMVSSRVGVDMLPVGSLSMQLEFHIARCIHSIEHQELGSCLEIVRHGDSATLPVNIVRVDAVSGPDNFETTKVDSSETGYVKSFTDLDWLSLPLGAVGDTAEFTVTPYPNAI